MPDYVDFEALPFLEGQGRDGGGRTVAEVIAMDDLALEREHDWVQWAFPLCERSRAVLYSPHLSPDELAAIKASSAALVNATRMLDRVTRFYTDTEHWLTRSDHNHLRITRIIASTALIRGPRPAIAFHDAILRRNEAAGGLVGPAALAYWLQARPQEPPSSVLSRAAAWLRTSING